MKAILTRIEPRSFAMADGDKRTATRYAVSIQGVAIGEIEKRSTESWTLRMHRLLGYSLYWEAKSERGKVVAQSHASREHALVQLIDAARRSRMSGIDWSEQS